VAVGVEVGAIGAEGLKRNDAAGADVFSVQQRLKGLQYGSIGGLGQQTQQRALSLEQAAQHSRDGIGDPEEELVVASPTQSLRPGLFSGSVLARNASESETLRKVAGSLVVPAP